MAHVPARPARATHWGIGQTLAPPDPVEISRQSGASRVGSVGRAASGSSVSAGAGASGAGGQLASRTSNAPTVTASPGDSHPARRRPSGQRTPLRDPRSTHSTRPPTAWR